MFKNKDPIPKDRRSNVVYQVNCTTCSATYIGETTRQVCRRLKEHGAPSEAPIKQQPDLRRSARIAANTKLQVFYGQSSSSEEEHDNDPSSDVSAILHHINQTKHKMDWENVSVLGSDQHPYRLLVKESLAIAEVSPNLNVTTRSIPLIIYPEGCTTIRQPRSITNNVQ